VIGLLLACAPPEGLPLGSTAADCAACHPDHAAEWRGSAHAVGGSHAFDAWLPEVEAAWGGFAADRCVGCHRPGFGGDEGVGCVACHAAVGNHGEADGALAVDLSAPLSGPFGATAAPTVAHSSTPRELLGSDSLCGTCHEVTGPGLLHETTLSEHRAAGGEGCVECHAPRVVDRPLVPGGAPRPSRDHRFGLEDGLYGEALALTVEPRGEERVLVLRAEGATHDVPTGAAFVRRWRVELAVEAAASTTILSLGDDPLWAGAPVALVTDADEVRPGRLGAGEEVEWGLPAQGAVEARVWVEAVRTEVADALGVEAPAPVEVSRLVESDPAPTR